MWPVQTINQPASRFDQRLDALDFVRQRLDEIIEAIHCLVEDFHLCCMDLWIFLALLIHTRLYEDVTVNLNPCGTQNINVTRAAGFFRPGGQSSSLPSWPLVLRLHSCGCWSFILGALSKPHLKAMTDCSRLTATERRNLQPKCSWLNNDRASLGDSIQVLQHSITHLLQSHWESEKRIQNKIIPCHLYHSPCSEFPSQPSSLHLEWLPLWRCQRHAEALSELCQGPPGMSHRYP